MMLLFPVIFFQNACESIIYISLPSALSRDKILILSSTNYFLELLFFDKLIKGNINSMNHCSNILEMENQFYHFLYVPPEHIEI